MALYGVPLIVKRGILRFLFKLLRILFVILQKIVWKIRGTAQKKRDAAKPENYDQCVQVLDVVAKYHFDTFLSFALEDFICIHNRFEHPQYILDNDHISLLTINKEDAIFVEATSDDMLLWKSKYSAFMRDAQVQNCRRLLVVPLPAFHRMSDEMGDPKEGELIFVFDHGRCGSTLLTQLMEFTGVCVTASQPDAPNVIATRYVKEGDTPELRQIVKSSFRLLCRPYKSFQPLAYLVKFTSFTICAMSLFLNVFPNARSLYVYRGDLLRTAQSRYRLSYQRPSVGLVYIVGKVSAFLTEKAVNAMGFDGKPYRVRLHDNFTFGIMTVISATVEYLKHRKSGCYKMAAIRYEDLVAEPLFMCREILLFCGLPLSVTQCGLKAMNIDSQRNTVLSRVILGKYDNPMISNKTTEIADELLRKNGLPSLSEKLILDGTITANHN